MEPMEPIALSSIVLLCVFGGALFGVLIRRRLPGHHLSEASKDTVKLATGVIATMAALVLGLLVSSAKGSFDRMSDELTQAAVKVIELDHALRNFGPEAQPIRHTLYEHYRAAIDALATGDRSLIEQRQAAGTTASIGGLQSAIRALAPQNDAQRETRARALSLAEESSANRWLLVLQRHTSVSMPMVVVVVTWLTLIFVGFGLFAPANGTVVTALLLCATSVAGALFLILEMDDPFGGIVRLSDVPMRRALEIIGGA
jgi:hypothetical protein